MGTRLEDCPGLADELSKLGEKKSASKPSKHKWVEESDLEQALDSPTPCTPIHKKYCKADKHHTHTSTPTITSSCHQCHTIVIRSSTQSLASSCTWRVNSTSCHLLSKTKKSPYLLVNKCMSIANKGKQLFPTSFYTVDVIDGFEDMDRKSSQRRPRMLNKDAFESTFQVTYVRPTYQKAHCLYEDNCELASKFSGYGRTKQGAWANFHNTAEAGGGGWQEWVRLQWSWQQSQWSHPIGCPAWRVFAQWWGRHRSIGANTATTAMKNFLHALHRYCWIYRPTLTRKVSMMAQMDMMHLLIQTIGTFVPSWRQ